MAGELSCCNRQNNAPDTPVNQTNGKKTFSQKVSDFGNRMLPTVEVVCRLALGIFAFILNPMVSLCAAGAGALIGCAYTLYKNINKEPIEKGDLVSTCATGFMEQLSGKRFPKVILTVVTAVFISIHYHHPAFVGFCMVPWGMFVGSAITQAAWNLTYREIYRLNAPPIKNIRDLFTQMPTAQTG